MSPKSDAAPGSPAVHMNVRKRNGNLEPINLEKIVKAVTRSARGITDVDPARVAAKTIGGIYDGATTQELDKLSIETAASLIPEHSNYSKHRLAAMRGMAVPQPRREKITEQSADPNYSP